MGATTDFRRSIEENRILYLSTLEAYRASIRENDSIDSDLIKVITQPRKDLDISFINHNYYITMEIHLRTMQSNQNLLRKSILINLMSALEHYLKFSVKTAFISAPKLFSNVKSKQELEPGYVVRLGSYSNITSSFLEREIRKIGERSLSETGDFFRKNLDIDFQVLGARWDRILQASRYRNSIVHSNSIIRDEVGKELFIDIGHWFLIQLMDDLYALSVEVGKSLKRNIEKQEKSNKDIDDMAVVLLEVDSGIYDELTEFRQNYSFYDSSGKLRQFSEFYNVSYSRNDGKVYAMITDNIRTVSAYVRNFKRRHRDLDKSQFKYYKIYIEDANDPLPDWRTIEKVEVAIGYGLDDQQIVAGLSESRGDTKPIERAIDIVKNSLTENAIKTIDTLVSDEDLFSNFGDTLNRLNDEYLFGRHEIAATLRIIAAKRLHQLLLKLHLIY